MKCPNCGFDIPEGEHKCMRCGNIIKAVTVTHYDDDHQDESTEDNSETIDIDPSKVRMGRGESSNPFDGIFGGGSIFGGFNSILDGLFGNIFDVFGDSDDEDDDDEQYVAYDDFGNPFPIDVYDRDFIEVKDVEILDEDGNVIEKNGKKPKSDKKNDGKKKKKDDK